MERDENFNQAVRNGILLIAGICMAVAIGTFGLVKLLGLDGGGGDDPSVSQPEAPRTPLPSSALPVPGKSESADPGEELAPETPGAKGLRLSLTPVFVRPMERINVTGTYKGQDAMQLLIQRKENGKWVDFPTEARVRAGSFSTYIMTGRIGDNRFRVYDPRADKGSNAVVVTVK